MRSPVQRILGAVAISCCVALLGAGCQDTKPGQADTPVTVQAPASAHTTITPAAPAGGPAPEEVARLVQALGADTWQARSASAARLRETRALQAVPALLRALREEAALTREQLERRAWREKGRDDEVAAASTTLRDGYALAIRTIGPDAEPQVRAELRTASPSYAAYLYIALATWGRRDALAPVCRLLKDSDDGYVRAAAADALGRLGCREAIPALRTATTDLFVPSVKSDRVFYLVRECALTSLRKLGEEDVRQSYPLPPGDMMHRYSSGRPPSARTPVPMR